MPATMWLAPTTIGLTALSRDFFFTSKVHFQKYIQMYIYITCNLILKECQVIIFLFGNMPHLNHCLDLYSYRLAEVSNHFLYSLP